MISGEWQHEQQLNKQKGRCKYIFRETKKNIEQMMIKRYST